MKEISFCPYCSASAHHLIFHPGDFAFCKECNTFFQNRLVELKCPKCDSVHIENSEFPGANGEVILQCKKCKKMYNAPELIRHSISHK